MKPWWIIALALTTLSFGGSERMVVKCEKAPAPIGPYSQAIMHHNLLFVSGQIALTKDNAMDTANIEAETRRVLDNISSILESAGLSMAQVDKATIYCTDLSSFKRINDVYATYFSKDPPARETVGVAKLPKGAHVEISVIASR